MVRKPDFELDVYLVPHGFEAHILSNGEENIRVMLRDFGGSYEVETLQEFLHEATTVLLGLFAQDPTMKDFLDG